MIGIVDALSRFCEVPFRRCRRKTLLVSEVRRLSYLAMWDFNRRRNTSNPSSNKASARANPANSRDQSPLPAGGHRDFPQPGTRLAAAAGRIQRRAHRQLTATGRRHHHRVPLRGSRRRRAAQRTDAGHHQSAVRNTRAAPLPLWTTCHRADLDAPSGAGVPTPLNNGEAGCHLNDGTGHRFRVGSAISASRMPKRAQGPFPAQTEAVPEPLAKRRRALISSTISSRVYPTAAHWRRR